MNANGQLFTFGRNMDFVASLVNSHARFMIVGGLAVHYYVGSREVDDLDVLIEQTRENAEKVLVALASPLLHVSITVEQLIAPTQFQLPIKRDFYLDLLTPGTEIDFAREYGLAKDARLGKFPVKVAAVSTLRRMLAQSAEPKHANDLALLKNIEG